MKKRYALFVILMAVSVAKADDWQKRNKDDFTIDSPRVVEEASEPAPAAQPEPKKVEEKKVEEKKPEARKAPSKKEKAKEAKVTKTPQSQKGSKASASSEWPN